MTAQTAPPVTRPANKHCRCQLGWTGVAGAGSTLDKVDDYPLPCPRMTRKSFAQGHDARMASRLAKEVAAGETTAEIAVELVQRAGGTGALVSKMLHSAKLRIENAKKKGEKAAAAPVRDDGVDLELEGAKNLASDSGVTLEEAKVQLGLDGQSADGSEEPDMPTPGDEVQAIHGKRTFKATVIEADGHGVLARHFTGKQSKPCFHDPETGEMVSIEDPAEVPF